MENTKQTIDLRQIVVPIRLEVGTPRFISEPDKSESKSGEIASASNGTDAPMLPEYELLEYRCKLTQLVQRPYPGIYPPGPMQSVTEPAGELLIAARSAEEVNQQLVSMIKDGRITGTSINGGPLVTLFNPVIQNIKIEPTGRVFRL